MTFSPRLLIQAALKEAPANGAVDGKEDNDDLLARLQLDSTLVSQVMSEMATLQQLSRVEQTVWELVRNAVDPHNATIMINSPTPHPFDLIEQVLNPVLGGMLVPLAFLIDRGGDWKRRTVRVYNSFLVLLALSAVAGSAYVILWRNWWLYRDGLGLFAAVVLVAYLIGLGVRIIQGVRYDDQLRNYDVSMQRMLDESYQENVRRIIARDPDYSEAKIAVDNEFSRLSRLIADTYIPDAVRRDKEAVTRRSEQRVRATSRLGAGTESPTTPIARKAVRRQRGSTARERIPTTNEERLEESPKATPRGLPPLPGPACFISYVHEDSQKVNRLAKELRNSGINVWVDKDSLQPGVRWKDVIRKSIRSGGFFIACFSLSSESKDRSYMREELALAIDEIRQRPRDRAWFIPVILTATQIPETPIGPDETLRDIQYVSLVQNWRKNVDDLIAALTTQTDTPK